MRLFRRRRGAAPGTTRTASSADRDHLTSFVHSRRGVEAYVEPRTTVTEMTIVLVAADGEWTRRRIPGPQAAREFGNSLGIPVYDVAATGYPQRMRAWTARRKANGQTGVPGVEGPSL
ncbi:MAG: oxidoreductase [Mycobacteriales bacterium]